MFILFIKIKNKFLILIYGSLEIFILFEKEKLYLYNNK